MNLTITFHALWMLCAVGSLVFAAVAASRVSHIIALFAGALLGLFLFGPARLPDAVAIAALAAAATLVHFWRPRYAMVGAISGGVLAGAWAVLLQVQALPWPAAAAMVAGALGITVWLSRSRGRFAPAALCDEALLVVLALAVTVAMIPSILDGWQSAVAFTVQAEADAASAIPAWTLGLVATSIALGGLHSLWGRR